MKRKAFTVIELMVSIGILLILVGIAYVSIKTIGAHTRAQATKTTLASLDGMLAELVSRDRSVLNGPPFRSYSPTGFPQGVSFQLGGGVAAEDVNDPDRYGTPVMITQRVMRRLAAMPANKVAFAQIPADRRIAPKWASGVDYEPGDTVWFWVPPNQRVNKQNFLCQKAHTSGGQGPGGANWLAANANTQIDVTPVLADAWGNPIIYVPGGFTPGFGEGLANVRAKNSDTYNAGSSYTRGARVIVGGFYFTALQASRGVTPSTAGQSRNFWFRGVIAPDGRPCFASAGDDGAFAALRNIQPAGDDNIYSFEK